MKSIKLIRSFIYMLMSSGVVLVLSAGIALTLAKLLSKHDLGLLMLGEAFIELFNFFYQTGFKNSILKTASEDKGGLESGLNKAVGNALLLKAMISIPASIIIFFIVNATQPDLELRFIIHAYIIIFLCDSFSSVFGITRRALHQFKLMSILNGITKLSQLIGIIVILKFFGGLKLLVIILVIVRISKLIISAITTLQLVKPKIDLALIKPMLHDSFHYGVLESLDGIENKIDRVMLGNILGPQAVALYSIPSKLNRAIVTIPQTITQVFLPKLQDTAINNEKKFLLMCKYLSRFLAIVGCFVFIFLYYFSEMIIYKLFGNKYIESIYIAQLFAFINLMWYLENIPELILMSRSAHKQRLITKILAIGINILLNILWIPTMGLEGAIYATIIANVINLCCYLFFTRESIAFNKILLITIYPLVLVFYLPVYILLPTYLVYLFVIRAVNHNDIDIMLKTLKLRQENSDGERIKS